MNFKTTLILLAVIGALVAAVFLIPDQKDRDDPEPSRRLFPDYAEPEISRIEIERPSGDTTTLVRRDDVWRLFVGEIEVRADADRVRDLLDPFDDMRPRQTVGEASAQKRAEYGLTSEGRMVVRLHREGGGIHELRLGAATPQRSGAAYACVGEDGPVVVISDTVLSAAVRPGEDFRDLEPVGIRSYEVATLEVSRRGADGFRATFDTDGQVWKITAVREDAERALGRGDMEAVEFLRLAATELAVDGTEGFVTDAPSDEDLEGYGLAEPAFTIALTPREEGAVRTLRIGRREGEGDEAVFFWSIAGEPSVYRSWLRPDTEKDEGLLDRLEWPLIRYRDRSLLRLDAYAKAEEIRLRAGDLRIHLKMRENEDQVLHWRILEPDVQGWAQDEVVDGFVRDLKKLEVARFADDVNPGDAGLGEGATPTAVLEVRMVEDEEFRIFTLGSEVAGVGHHFRRGEDDLLVVAPPELLDVIRRPWFRFRHREVTRGSQAMATRIEVMRGGVREVVVREGNDWSVEEDSEAVADESAWQDMLATFAPLRADEKIGFVAQGSESSPLDLAAWGLADPAVTVRLTWVEDGKESVVTLRVGTAVDGRHHARTEGAGARRDSLIFALSERAWQAVMRPLILDE